MLNTITFILVLFGQVSADIPAPPEIDEAYPDNAAVPSAPAIPDEVPVVPEEAPVTTSDVPETPALDAAAAPTVPDVTEMESPQNAGGMDVPALDTTAEDDSVPENAEPVTQAPPKPIPHKNVRMIPPPLLPPPSARAAVSEVNDPLLVNPSTLDVPGDSVGTSPYSSSGINSEYNSDQNDMNRALQNPSAFSYDSAQDDDLYDAQLQPNQGKGHIMPIDQAEVPAQEQGVLTKFFIREGYEVKKDDPLAQIDDEQAKMSVQVQQAKLNAAEREASNDVNIRYAKAARNVAEAELKSAKETIARVPGAVPATEIRKLELSVVQAALQIEQSTNQFEISKYQVDVSKAELDAAKLGVSRRVVKSPISGIIVEKYRNEGEWVKPGDPIVKVVYFEKLRVKTTFDINRIPMQRVMKHNAKITVVQKPSMTFNGKVVFANPVIQSGGAYEVWIDVENVQEKDGFWALQPGMNAVVTIE